jgi:hypothetical protein
MATDAGLVCKKYPYISRLKENFEGRFDSLGFWYQSCTTMSWSSTERRCPKETRLPSFLHIQPFSMLIRSYCQAIHPQQECCTLKREHETKYIENIYPHRHSPYRAILS